MATFLPYKFVIVINKNLEPGVALNAASHLALGLVGSAQKADIDEMHFVDYSDANGTIYPSISGCPAIILIGTSNEIKKILDAARDQKILHTAFLETMTGGTYIEQLDRTKNTKDVVYYGAALFGKKDILDPLTKRLSLYK